MKQYFKHNLCVVVKSIVNLSNFEFMREKLANLFLDVGKYIVTAVIISSLFTNFDRSSWQLYLISGTATLAVVGVGLWLVRGEKKKERS